MKDVELGLWLAVLVLPGIAWVNGPSVSNDQWVVRCLVIATALLGAIGLRIRFWRQQRLILTQTATATMSGSEPLRRPESIASAPTISRAADDASSTELT